MSERQLENVDFEVIRYANCWEDADILLRALRLDNSSKVMSIASAGDNSFSLASAAPQRIIAFDISKVQLYLTELKREAIRQMDRDSYMEFVGFTDSPDRLEAYDDLWSELSDDCRNYWDNRSDDIEKGVIHTGKFEQYFQLFKKDFLHNIHSQKTVDELFRTKPEADQRNFHDSVWHNDEWKKMYGFFFGEQMMGDKGRDPEFLKHVEGSVSDMILAQEVAHLRTSRAQKNYFLYYILNNQFSEQFLPHYVRKNNYDKVRENISKVDLFHGLLNAASEAHSDCTHFNLSDIFEYMDPLLFKRVSRHLLDHSSQNSVFAFWNLMIPRNMADLYPEEVAYNQLLSEQLTQQDMGYFYRSFIINTKK